MIAGLKPLFLVTPGSVSQKDIRRVERGCGIVMVECKEPDAARYSEPPIGADLDEQARAALSLLRVVISNPAENFSRAQLTKWFVEQLLSWKKPENIPPVKQAAKKA